MYRDTHTHVICVCIHSLEEVECIPLKGECARQELYTTDNGILHAMMDYTEIRCRGSISDRHSCVSCVTATRCQRCKWKWSRRSLCVEEDKTTCGQMRIDLNERSLLSKRVYRRGMYRWSQSTDGRDHTVWRGNHGDEKDVIDNLCQVCTLGSVLHHHVFTESIMWYQNPEMVVCFRHCSFRPFTVWCPVMTGGKDFSQGRGKDFSQAFLRFVWGHRHLLRPSEFTEVFKIHVLPSGDQRWLWVHVGPVHLTTTWPTIHQNFFSSFQENDQRAWLN